MLSDDAHFEAACEALDVDLTVVYGLGELDFGMVSLEPGVRRIFVEDSSGAESVLLGLMRAGLDMSEFDAIYSTHEGGMFCAAMLSQIFGMPSISVQAAALFRDKSLAKAVLRDAGVDAAAFLVIEDLCDLSSDYTPPFAHAVLKPIAAGGAWHASTVRSAADMQLAAARAREERPSGPRAYILEEFMTGDELHADGVMFDGRLEFLSIGGYRDPCLSVISNRGWMVTYVLDPHDDAAMYEIVAPFVERALRELGLVNGVFHMELFHDADAGRLVFGECAARRGGGLIEEEIYQKFGVSLSQAAVHCALGVRPLISAHVQPGVVGSVFLPYVPGILFDRPSAADLISLPNVEFAAVDWPIGFTMGDLTSTLMKAGQAMLVAGSREELFRRGDEVIAWFNDRMLVIPQHASARELRQWHANASPGADGKPTARKARRAACSPVGAD